MSDDDLLAEIRAQFSGTCPNVLRRMHEAGELAQHWPGIRAVLTESEPLPKAVVEALCVVMSLRCSQAYCFVMHSLTLFGQGATSIAIEDLARVFAMPAIVPDHERWSRVLKLAWLTRLDGPHRGAAAFILRQQCSEAELEQIERSCEVAELLNCFVADSRVALDGDPMLAQLPDELRRMIPEFVQFHIRLNHTDTEQRPVAAACSVCREIRSLDGGWYPLEVIQALLADDVLFSHGLCPRCMTEHGVPAKLRCS